MCGQIRAKTEPGKWRLAPNAPAPLAGLLPGGELNPDVPEFVPHFLQHAVPAETAAAGTAAGTTATESAAEPARSGDARHEKGAWKRGDGWGWLSQVGLIVYIPAERAKELISCLFDNDY